MPEHQQIQQSKKPNTIFQKQATSVIQTPFSNPYSIIQRARINPKSLTHADIMQLQRTIGNRAVAQLLSGIVNSSTVHEAPVQRSEIPEEEEKPMQGKFETVQRSETPEEEETLQGKMVGTIQRQEIPEEEEPLQGKFENKPEIACPSCLAASIVQRQEIPEEEESLQGKFESIQRQEIPEEEEPLQTKRENNTGMPDNLKAGVESLSGIDMSDVRVHYNSDKPAEVRALAYTQGTNIHVAPGQERHLPHEAWHVVQQAQDRVKPTMQLKYGIPVNDDKGLEYEADMMGAKALQMKFQGDKGQSVANEFSQMQSDENAFQVVDNCPSQHQVFSLIGSNQKVPADYPQQRLQNSNVVQKKFVLDENEPIEKAIDVLANSTVAGQVAMEKGNCKLNVEESTSWKALTKDRIGISIPMNEFKILKEWEGGKKKTLEKEDEYAVLVAHELTHLRHFLEAPGTYAVRGLKGHLSKWGSKWDADEEEELTIKGFTKVKKSDWDDLYKEALKIAGFDDKTAAKNLYLKEIEDDKPKHLLPDSTKKIYIGKIKKLDEEITAILRQYDKVPKKETVREEDDFYIFEDKNTENTSRKEKGFKYREKYENSKFEKE